MRSAYPFRDAFNWSIDLLLMGRGPLWLRRLVVLTFPVSIPAWFVLTTALLVASMVEMLVVGVAGLLADMWRK